MGWEKRGSHEYYYRKERDGSNVKSVYVGRGEIAPMISQFQASSAIVERLTRAQTIESSESQKAKFLRPLPDLSDHRIFLELIVADAVEPTHPTGG